MKTKKSINIKNDKYLERKNIIIEAAGTVFARKGFYAATVDEIAAVAKIAKGTVYLYFKNKETLFLSLVEHSIKSIIEIITTELESNRVFIKKLNIILLRQLEFFENNKNIFRIFISGEQEGMLRLADKKTRKRLFELNKFRLTQLNRLMELGIKEKVIKFGDIQKITLAFAGIVYMFAKNWLDNDSNNEGSLSAQTDMIIDIFINGVGR